MRINESLFSDLTYFTKYKVVNDERPDQVSHKLYKSPDFHWTFFVINELLKESNEIDIIENELVHYGPWNETEDFHYSNVKNVLLSVPYEKGKNTDVHPESGNLAFTIANNLFVAVNNEQFQVTNDNDKGIDLITATNRRNPPQCVDSKIHHCNLINNIEVFYSELYTSNLIISNISPIDAINARYKCA